MGQLGGKRRQAVRPHDACAKYVHTPEQTHAPCKSFCVTLLIVHVLNAHLNALLRFGVEMRVWQRIVRKTLHEPFVRVALSIVCRASLEKSITHALLARTPAMTRILIVPYV